MTRAGELRELNEVELEHRLSEAKEELFNLRFQNATGQLDNSARLGQVRKDIARVETLLREREIAAAEALGTAAGDGRWLTRRNSGTTRARCAKAWSSRRRWTRRSSSRSSTASATAGTQDAPAARGACTRTTRSTTRARGRPGSAAGDAPHVPPEALACHRGPREGEVSPTGEPAQGRRQLGRPRGLVHQGPRRHPTAVRGASATSSSPPSGRRPRRGREEGRSGQVRRRADAQGAAARPDGSYIDSTRTPPS